MSKEIPTFLAVLIEKLKADADVEQLKLYLDDDGSYRVEFREDLWSVEGDDRDGDFHQKYKIVVERVGDIEFKPYQRYNPLKSICECENCVQE